jgi:hypothetical protein
MKDIVNSRVTDEHEICLICGWRFADHTHHLICGISNRDFADKYGLTIPVCAICHNELHESGVAVMLSKMLGQAIWEKNYYKDLYYNLNRDEDEARDRFRELHDDCGSYL